MDRQIRDNLEEYVRGAMKPATLREFEQRLDASNEETRRTVRTMREQSGMIREAFGVSEDVCPAAGFYGRVMACIEVNRNTSVWFAFLEPQFSRRLAFASLTLLVLLSLTMFTTSPEREQATAVTEAPSYHVMDAMAQQELAPVTGENPDEDRDVVLVNLATHQEY
jgi:hypothetical protein